MSVLERVTANVTNSQLAQAAWAARERSRAKTQVGCAVVTADEHISLGCNIEHRFRCHDIHAEIAALARMASAGRGPALAVMVVADRERFTPCGSCLDWIMELGGPETWVMFQGEPGGLVEMMHADELMPHYPR